MDWYLLRYKRMLGTSFKEHKTNEYAWQQVNILARSQELLLSTVASYHDLVMSAVTIRCQNMEQNIDCSHRRGRLRKSRKDSIKEWTCQSAAVILVVVAHCRRQKLMGDHHNADACLSGT